MQMLEKTVSIEAHARHGNPFSDDGSSEGRHDKSPLLIGSADSSYNMDTPRRCVLASSKLSTRLRPSFTNLHLRIPHAVPLMTWTNWFHS